ncbi:MAG: MerR family transcriptional regulator [Solobacterium sp.]|nr:MerR family transcriptional regulator [Solobacterium sp.]
MKINQLSRLTGLNPETIRSYRKNGYLNPVRQENGYYEYSINDYTALAHLRKLRGLGLSFDMIDSYYNASDNRELIDIIEREKNELKRRTAIMQAELRYLEIEKQHILQSDREAASFIDVEDDKYDFFFYNKDMNSSIMAANPDIYYLCSGTVRIRKEDLNSGDTDRTVPIETGIGSYRYILEENNIIIPDHMIRVIPKGKSICQIITIDDLTCINLKILEPMIRLARNNGCVFTSDTTGFLMRMIRENGKFRCQYRIRASVAEQD